MVGYKATHELLVAGGPISARRALEIGLVNRVVPRDRVREGTADLAKKLMASSPASLRIIKETVNKGLGNALYECYIASRRFLYEVSKYEDFQEGAQAFMEKSPPNFKGR